MIVLDGEEAIGNQDMSLHNGERLHRDLKAQIENRTLVKLNIVSNCRLKASVVLSAQAAYST